MTIKEEIMLSLDEEKILTQKEMADYYQKIPAKENTYKKKKMLFDFKIADSDQKITTEIDGKKETSNTAKKGDYILTGTRGEKYVLTPEKFNSRYKIKGDKAETIPVKTKAKIVEKPIKFMASWGEKMIANSGDAIVNNDGEYYRIEKKAFKNTYKKV